MLSSMPCPSALGMLVPVSDRLPQDSGSQRLMATIKVLKRCPVFLLAILIRPVECHKQAMMAQQKMMADPEFAMGMAALMKNDPELKNMFDEIKTMGPEALSKYWDDTDIMSKISKKVTEMKMANMDSSEAADDKVMPGHAYRLLGHCAAIARSSHCGAIARV